MTLLNIVEFATIQAYPTTDTAQIAKTPAVTTQEMTPTSSSQLATAFADNTQLVRLCCDTTCRIEFGIGTSVATAIATTSLRITADSPEYFGVSPGQRMAVILGS